MINFFSLDKELPGKPIAFRYESSLRGIGGFFVWGMEEDFALWKSREFEKIDLVLGSGEIAVMNCAIYAI
ncbi:MAG: hypothetical protein ACXIUD_10845 [Mongoliitalea sp.]